VAAIGEKNKYFTSLTPQHSFGSDSFWAKFLKAKGKICNFNFDAGSTFVHFVEKSLKVPYRFDKTFRGTIHDGEKTGLTEFVHYVFDHNSPDHAPDFPSLDRKVRELDLLKVARLGKGEIKVLSSEDCYRVIENELPKDPLFLTMDKQGSAHDDNQPQL